LVPLANLYTEVIKVAADARNRVEAASLAAQQIGIARATSFTTLAAEISAPPANITQQDAGMTYTIAQSAQWYSGDGNVANACGGGAGSGEPILALTDTVTWVGMGTTKPVVSQTDISAPASYYSTGTLGNLAVTVEDSQNNPVAGATVTITNTSPPDNTEAISTGATGCALAGFIATGSYNIVVQDNGYVAPSEALTATATGQAVGAGDTQPVTLLYAPAANVPISYAETAPVLTAPANTLASYPVTVNSTGNTPTPITYPAAPPPTLQLWPYSNGYDIYAGGCTDNDISTLSGYQALAVSQGVTTPDTLQLYSLSIQANKTISNPTVTATDTTSGCTNNTVSFTPTLTGNAMTIALPMGTYDISVKATDGSVSPTEHVSTYPITMARATGSQETNVTFP
jgi:hypothetical protein